MYDVNKIRIKIFKKKKKSFVVFKYSYATLNLCCAVNQYREITGIFSKILNRSVSSKGINTSIEVINVVKEQFDLIDLMEYI